MMLQEGQSCVYWIRAPHHSDVTLDGYVGVSKNPRRRWHCHFWSMRRGRHENPILVNAIAKYEWKSLVKQVLLVGSEEYCYAIEAALRPNAEIGWNVNAGGTKPPRNKPRGPNYVSPLKGRPSPKPWLVGVRPKCAGRQLSSEEKVNIGTFFRGRKQSPEQVAKRVASRKATLMAQGRTR
jgi:hypothetical protein